MDVLLLCFTPSMSIITSSPHAFVHVLRKSFRGYCTSNLNYPASCNVITVIGVVIWHEKESYVHI